MLIEAKGGGHTPASEGVKSKVNRPHPSQRKKLKKINHVDSRLLSLRSAQTVASQSLHLSNRHNSTLVHLALGIEGTRCRRPPHKEHGPGEQLGGSST